MRLMSFSLTEDALVSGRKTVTRRVGWGFLRAGDQFVAVDKAMGLRKGQSPRRLGICTVLDARRERLNAITAADCAAEGFPEMAPAEFVAMFCRAMRVQPDALVTRIEFRFEPRPAAAGGGA